MSKATEWLLRHLEAIRADEALHRKIDEGPQHGPVQPGRLPECGDWVALAMVDMPKDADDLIAALKKWHEGDRAPLRELIGDPISKHPGGAPPSVDHRTRAEFALLARLQGKSWKQVCDAMTVAGIVDSIDTNQVKVSLRSEAGQKVLAEWARATSDLRDQRDREEEPSREPARRQEVQIAATALTPDDVARLRREQFLAVVPHLRRHGLGDDQIAVVAAEMGVNWSP